MNEYLNQIEISGVTYDLVASGSSSGGVTPEEVQIMINESISGKADVSAITVMSGDTNVISGDVITISGDVIELSESLDKVSGDVIVLSGDVKGLETKLDTLSGNVYTKSETSGKTELDTEFGKYYKKTETSSKTEIDDALNQKQDILIVGSGISIVNNVISASGGGITSGEVMDIVSGYTYDKDTIDDKIASGGTFDPTLYYKKSETSGKTEIQNALDLKLDASAFTESDYYKKSETSGKTELSTEFAKYYKKDETSGKTELSNEFALYYKKDETSGKTELADEFDKYYKKSETSSKTEIDDAFSAITKVIEDNEKVVARALNDLNEKKVESGDVIDIVSGYTYDKNEIDDKILDSEGRMLDAIDAAVSADTEDIKQDVAQLQLSAVTDAQYDSTAKTINFYNLTGGTVASVDATDFIKDGMVQDVQIVEIGGVSYLRITFNTESGQENIDIDLSQIFDANNYYTKSEVYNKTEVDNKFWCGDSQAWSQISGSTQSGVLYLVY